MTLDEAIAEIVTRTPLSADDIRDLLAAETQDDIALLIRSYESAGAGPDATGWQTFAIYLREVADVAIKVGPILGVVASLA